MSSSATRSKRVPNKNKVCRRCKVGKTTTQQHVCKACKEKSRLARLQRRYAENSGKLGDGKRVRHVKDNELQRDITRYHDYNLTAIRPQRSAIPHDYLYTGDAMGLFELTVRMLEELG